MVHELVETLGSELLKTLEATRRRLGIFLQRPRHSRESNLACTALSAGKRDSRRSRTSRGSPPMRSSPPATAVSDIPSNRQRAGVLRR